MTTYELPPEPPNGSRVKDREGAVWQAHNHEWHRDGSSVWRVWPSLLMDHGPLTLIEPDPWPTAPLIVADWTSGGQQGGRGLLYRETDADQYWTIRENESVYPEHTGDALTNVVPVTVVPTAEWEALVDAWRGGMRQNILADHVGDLIAATDALGLD